MKDIRTLRIQLTQRCNLRCLFCCHEGTICSFNIIKDDNITNLIKACYDQMGIKRVKFTGGEPLLHDGSIVSVMRGCGDRDISWSIVTNATDYSQMKEYLDINNLDVTVSLPVPLSAEINEYFGITLADDDRVGELFNNVKETITYAINTKRPIKINYVLCKGKNDSDVQISEMIGLVKKFPFIDLRFLETVVNDTNDKGNRMKAFRVTEEDFIGKINLLQPKCMIDDSKRSHTVITLEDGTHFRLVKFFCNTNCFKCPEDKTSLWLTPNGAIKKCSFRSQMSLITDWTYAGLCRDLPKILNK